MDRGKTYKTSDGKIWFCIGHINRTPVCASWTGAIRKLSRGYRKYAKEVTWGEWLKQHKYFFDNCVVGGTDDDYRHSVNVILNCKL